MDIRQFAEASSLDERLEIEKVELLAFFHLARHEVTEFGISDVVEWFRARNFSEPNRSRLQTNLRQSRQFIRGTKQNYFRLHARAIEELRSQFPALGERSEAITAADTVLPEPLYTGTRGFIESLAQQINASYEHNIFDGCAVLMRRLLEVLLILSYQHLSIDAAIRDTSGNFVMLERIITDAETNSTLALSRNSKSFLDVFRTVGNFSAHKIYYNARRGDLKKHLLDYRALVEELLYKAGIRK